MIYLELFWSFFQIGLFSIGGGYAAMPLIQNQVVDIHPWLTMTQFADIMTIAEHLLVSKSQVFPVLSSQRLAVCFHPVLS